MAKIAFLGLGAMGSRMAKHLIAAQHTVTVWNRTPTAAEPLVSLGARQAATPAQAVIDADFVISMVRDDEAAQQVWLASDSGVLTTLPNTAIAIESATVTPAWIQRWSHACAAQGIRCMDAPVAGSRPQAEGAQLIFLVGADAAVFNTVQPILTVMGSAVHHCGAVGSGIQIKLAINALLSVQNVLLAELINVLRKFGVDAQKAVEIISATPVCSPAAKVSAGAMLAKNFAPLFPLALAAKDMGYLEMTAQQHQAAVPVSTAVHQVMQTAIIRGFGEDNITGIAQLYD